MRSWRGRRNAPPPIHRWYRYRIAALFTLAVFAIRFGLSYTPVIVNQGRRVPGALNFLTALFPPATEHWQPIWIFGAMWLGVGVIALAAVGWNRLHNLAFLAGSALTVYWFCAYFVSAFTDSDPADLLTGIFLFSGASFIVLVGLLTRPSDDPGFEHTPEPTPVFDHRVD